MNSSPRNRLPLASSLSPHTEEIAENPPMDGLPHDLVINCGENSRPGHLRPDSSTSDFSLTGNTLAAIPPINENERQKDAFNVAKREMSDPIQRGWWKENSFPISYKDLTVSKLEKAKSCITSKMQSGMEDEFNSLLINTQTSKDEKKRLKNIDRGILKELTASAERWSKDMMMWKPIEYEEKFKLPLKDGLKSLIKLFLLRNYGSLEEKNKTFAIQEVQISSTVHCLKGFLSLAVELDRLASADNSASNYFPHHEGVRFLVEVILFIKNQLYLYQAIILKTIEEENCKNLIARYVYQIFLPTNSQSFVSWELSTKRYILQDFSEGPYQGISELLDDEGWKMLESIYIGTQFYKNPGYQEDRQFTKLIVTFNQLESWKNKTIIKRKIDIILSKCFEIIERLSIQGPHQLIQDEIHKLNLIYKTMAFIFNYYKDYSPKIYFEAEYDEKTQAKIKLFEETIGFLSSIIKLLSRRASMIDFYHPWFGNFLEENPQFRDDLIFLKSLRLANTIEVSYIPKFYFLNSDLFSKENQENQQNLIEFSKRLESKIKFSNQDDILASLNKQCILLYERWMSQIKRLQSLLGKDSNDKFVESVEFYINWAIDFLSKLDNFLVQNHKANHHSNRI